MYIFWEGLNILISKQSWSYQRIIEDTVAPSDLWKWNMYVQKVSFCVKTSEANVITINDSDTNLTSFTVQNWVVGLKKVKLANLNEWSMLEI